MVVPDQSGTRSLGNSLRQQYGVPGCHYMPADPMDAAVVQAFFAALSPLALEAYRRALQAQRQSDAALDRASCQQRERWRYPAALAERQFKQVAPDNRWVAAELDRRGETARRERKTAQEDDEKAAANAVAAPRLSPDLQAACPVIGQKLPELWPPEVLSPSQKKALWRCLLDTVVIHRRQRDTVHPRLVWNGSETTAIDLPIPVGSWRERSHRAALEPQLVPLHRPGLADDTMAQHWTAQGSRAPMAATRWLPSTVQGLRRKHQLFVTRSHSPPRRLSGALTVPQVATALGVSPPWLYDRIKQGASKADRDADTGLSLFPDTSETLEQCNQFQIGTRKQLRFAAMRAGHSPASPDKSRAALV